MNKDEEIMRLKNDMPIKPKDGGSDRYDVSCPCFLELITIVAGLRTCS